VREKRRPPGGLQRVNWAAADKKELLEKAVAEYLAVRSFVCGTKPFHGFCKPSNSLAFCMRHQVICLARELGGGRQEGAAREGRRRVPRGAF
jgi:hypothetical protein